MAIKIRYMGAKHRLAPIVSEIIADLPSGPCLDLFAGMSSVAGSLAGRREAWCNDIQQYATLISSLLLKSRRRPQPESAKVLRKGFLLNQRKLIKRFGSDLALECIALNKQDRVKYEELSSVWEHAANSNAIAEEFAALRVRPTLPYRMITLAFSHGYFGLKQAIDLDSLKYAIDKALLEGTLDSEQARWCLAGVLTTASIISASTGHFAQFLNPESPGGFRRIVAYRKLDVWDTFVSTLEITSPFGNEQWRARNRVFEADALRLVPELRCSGVRPSIIYADPPYSKDQYSRYYHVLESIVKYDYPRLSGKGRYRPDRFSTPFSLRKSVAHAFRNLSESSSAIGSSLVISYPSNGLLFEVSESLSSILRNSYRDVRIRKIDYLHSTLGARHGSANSSVSELIYVARRPRL